MTHNHYGGNIEGYIVQHGNRWFATMRSDMGDLQTVEIQYCPFCGKCLER